MTYDFAFRELNMKVADFRWTACDIIKPEPERRRRLEIAATELKIAVDNFLRTCKENRQ